MDFMFFVHERDSILGNDVSFACFVLGYDSKNDIFDVDYFICEFSIPVDGLLLFTHVSQSENRFSRIICCLLIFQELYG